MIRSRHYLAKFLFKNSENETVGNLYILEIKKKLLRCGQHNSLLVHMKSINRKYFVRTWIIFVIGRKKKLDLKFCQTLNKKIILWSNFRHVLFRKNWLILKREILCSMTRSYYLSLSILLGLI